MADQEETATGEKTQPSQPPSPKPEPEQETTTAAPADDVAPPLISKESEDQPGKMFIIGNQRSYIVSPSYKTIDKRI